MTDTSSGASQELVEKYTALLRAYVKAPEEALRQRAYELVAGAIAGGQGVLEVAAAHGEALLGILADIPTVQESEKTVRLASEFLLEGLVAFEMTHRGYRDTVEKLNAANEALKGEHERLEERVEERTAELARANEDLRTEMTERKIVEEERERVLAELDATIESLSAGVFVYDPAGNVVRANPAAERLVGYSAADLRRPVAARLAQLRMETAEGRPFTAEEFPSIRALRGEVVEGVMMAFYRGDEKVWVLGSATPIRTRHGKVLGAVGTFVDITELHRLQEQQEKLVSELQQANETLATTTIRAQDRAEELDALIENMTEGVSIVDSGGRLVRINRAGKEIWSQLGLKREVGTPIAAMEGNAFYPDGQPVPKRDWPIARALQGRVFAQQELVYLRPDGPRLSLLFAGSSVRDEHERIRLAFVVYRDITEIRDLERQREEFISVVAHDLRGALTPIRGYADVLSRRPATKENLSPFVQRGLEGIATGSRRLERMVMDLLDASRIEARRLALEKEPVDLPWLVRDIVQRIEHQMEGHPVRVEVRGEIPPVKADPGRLEQVLTNLLYNAAKYSYPESTIRVAIEPADAEVVVSVMNLGSGIGPEDRERIFTRFHRTELAVEEKTPGLGLGLYIAKGLVEAHGGRIWVESKRGEYADFRFALPLA